jgi:hypothetical protein
MGSCIAGAVFFSTLAESGPLLPLSVGRFNSKKSIEKRIENASPFCGKKGLSSASAGGARAHA